MEACLYPRDWRILKPAEYQQVFKHAKAIRGKELTLLYISNSLSHPRVGMAISNKHSGNVVQRNRAKRLIREFFRQHMREIGGYDLVYVSKPSLAKVSNKKINDALENFKSRFKQKNG